MTSVVLWLVVLDLVPEVLHDGNKQCWVGAIWLDTTSIGMFIGWKVEDGRRVVIEDVPIYVIHYACRGKLIPRMDSSPANNLHNVRMASTNLLIRVITNAND